MEARPVTTLSDVTPTGSQTRVLTPEEIPDQVNKCLDIKKNSKKIISIRKKMRMGRWNIQTEIA